MARQFGHKVIGTVTGVKGNCGWGHKVGDKMELSGHDTAGLCGFFYHDIFPTLTALQFGAEHPWGDPEKRVVECWDRQNVVTIELTREK